MNSTTRELWYGNIVPNSDCRPKTAELKKLAEYITLHRNELLVTLNDEQREIYEKLDACWDEYIKITEEAIFSYAFKLGLKMTSEAFCENYHHE